MHTQIWSDQLTNMVISGVIPCCTVVYSEDGGSRFLWNAVTYLLNYMASQPKDHNLDHKRLFESNLWNVIMNTSHRHHLQCMHAHVQSSFSPLRGRLSWIDIKQEIKVHWLRELRWVMKSTIFWFKTLRQLLHALQPTRFARNAHSYRCWYIIQYRCPP